MDMLLSKDSLKRRYYNTKADLASALGVSEIVEVPVMEGVMRDGAEVLIIIVNLADYAVGSTRGGEITKFDDFDIDYNQYKYLIEGRLSGALQNHKRAQIITRGAGTLATPTAPTFNSSTGVITIPTVTGVTYKTQGTGPLGADRGCSDGAHRRPDAVDQGCAEHRLLLPAQLRRGLDLHPPGVRIPGWQGSMGRSGTVRTSTKAMVFTKHLSPREFTQVT
jgi:hypothetical protein